MPGTACAKEFTRYLRVVAFLKRKFPLDKGQVVGFFEERNRDRLQGV
jgi:hypothetical protein